MRGSCHTALNVPGTKFLGTSGVHITDTPVAAVGEDDKVAVVPCGWASRCCNFSVLMTLVELR